MGHRVAVKMLGINPSTMRIHNEYASLLQQFQWNYFITCRTPYKIHTMTVRNWITKLLKASNKVEQAWGIQKITQLKTEIILKHLVYNY